MDEQKIWLSIFATIIIVASVVIIFNPGGIEGVIRDGYRLLSIFFGMLAGIALGEVFKIRSNRKTGRALLSDLLEELKVRGYGWLRPEGVRQKLEEMTANWTGPPLLVG